MATHVIFHLIRLSSNVITPNARSRSSYDLFFRHFTSLVACLWTLSRHLMSFTKYDDYAWTAYSRWGLKYHHHRLSSTSHATHRLDVFPLLKLLQLVLSNAHSFFSPTDFKSYMFYIPVEILIHPSLQNICVSSCCHLHYLHGLDCCLFTLNCQFQVICPWLILGPRGTPL